MFEGVLSPFWGSPKLNPRPTRQMIVFTGKHDADVFVRGAKRVTGSPHQQRQLIIMSTPTDCAAGQSSFVDILESVPATACFDESIFCYCSVAVKPPKKHDGPLSVKSR